MPITATLGSNPDRTYLATYTMNFVHHINLSVWIAKCWSCCGKNTSFFGTHRQIGANQPKCEIVVVWLYSSDTNWQQLGELQPSSIVSDLCVCVFSLGLPTATTRFAMAEAKSVLATPGALQNAPCFRFLLLLQAEEIFLKMTNQEQLMMFKYSAFLTLIPYTFSAFLPHSSDNTRDSKTLHLPQVLPTWMLKCNFPSTAFRSRGLRELSFESKMCWEIAGLMENRDRPKK